MCSASFLREQGRRRVEIDRRRVLEPADLLADLLDDLGWQWPTETVTIPAKPSRYCLPVSSQRYCMCPSTISSGSR